MSKYSDMAWAQLMCLPESEYQQQQQLLDLDRAFCGECGKSGVTLNDNNDLCSDCESKISKALT